MPVCAKEFEETVGEQSRLSRSARKSSPEGRTNLGERFSAGKSRRNDSSPGGTTEFSAGGQGFTRLHNQRRGCPILARPLRKSLPCCAEAPSEAEGGVEGVGATPIAQRALPFTPHAPQMSMRKIEI